MNLALRTFIDEHALHIAERNLFRNFVVHCCNLFEFGVIGPAFVFAAVARMQNKFKELKVKTATEERRGRSGVKPYISGFPLLACGLTANPHQVEATRCACLPAMTSTGGHR